MKKVIMAVVIFMLMAGTAAGVYLNEPLSWDGWAWGTSLVSVGASLVGYGGFYPVEGASLMGKPNEKMGSFSYGPTIFQKIPFDKFYIFLDGVFVGVRLVGSLKGEKYIDEMMNYLIKTYSSLKTDLAGKDGKHFYSYWEGYAASIICENNRITLRPVVYVGTASFIKKVLESLINDGYIL